MTVAQVAPKRASITSHRATDVFTAQSTPSEARCKQRCHPSLPPKRLESLRISSSVWRKRSGRWNHRWSRDNSDRFPFRRMPPADPDQIDCCTQQL